MAGMDEYTNRLALIGKSRLSNSGREYASTLNVTTAQEMKEYRETGEMLAYTDGV